MYPAKGSEHYEPYIYHSKNFNKVIYRYLYSDDLLVQKQYSEQRHNYKINFEVPNPSYKEIRQEKKNALLGSETTGPENRTDALVPLMEQKEEEDSYANFARTFLPLNALAVGKSCLLYTSDAADE